MNKSEPRYIGRRVQRMEDYALLRGEGRYVDDIRLPGMLHAAFVRSAVAHARIMSIDTCRARALKGVAAVLTARDLAGCLASPRLPMAFPPGKLSEDAMPPILAADECTFVGEPIAIIIAETRHIAEDAADLVEIDYDMQPSVLDPREALGPDADLARLDAGSNLFTTIQIEYGGVEDAFADAGHVVRETFFQHRGMAQPIETRGIVVSVGPSGVMVWSSTQVPHELRNNIAEMLRFGPDGVRVVSCDVGGGFGCKFMVYSEEIAVAAASATLERPVKWIEDRHEHFLSAIQERDQYWDVEVAVDADGVLRGLRGNLIHDQGAYAPHSITVPYNSASSVLGPYVLPAYKMDVKVVRTNKPPVIPVRGAGYQQGTYIIERLLDRVACDLDIDRAEVRRRNLIVPDRMPYSTGLINRAGKAVIYDSGNYAACQERGLSAGKYHAFPERQARAQKEGRYLGMGIAHGVKCTGRGPFESALVRVAPSGRVSVYTGAAAIGQGTRTTLAQICADTLGVDLASVDVVCGDTAFVQYGLGAFGSRQTMIAGSAVEEASRLVREKAIAVASQIFESELLPPRSNAVRELEVAGGTVTVSGRHDLSISLGAVAEILRGAAGYAFPEGVGVGLEATHHFRADLMAYANSFHVCEVEVDVESGHVTVLRYIAVQDSGKIVNPLTAEGQVIGGIVHGLGNALLEQMRYDSECQPISTTLADYMIPTATEVPDIECIFNETLSPLNPMGMKGVGETSIIPVTATVASAIENALAPIGVRIKESPITPIRLLELIEKARAQDVR